MEKITVGLDSIISEFGLEVIYSPAPTEKILIECQAVNRPALQIVGYFDHFEKERIQIIGKVEHDYLQTMDSETRKIRLDAFLSHKPAAVIVTTSLSIPEELLDGCRKHEIPLMRTEESTSNFMAALIASLNVSLAPRITRHGVLVEVYGEGVLILGDSGIGKSETAIELVKRGHRLIADDAVEIKRVSAITLVGSAPEVIRHYMELRGIGIIDVRRLFGMGAVKNTEKIDMIIKLEHWDKNKMYDRFGLNHETTELLGIKIPTLTIPVSPGRNLAAILEIAAMNNRQKKMGYDTAYEFNKQIMSKYETEEKHEE